MRGSKGLPQCLGEVAHGLTEPLDQIMPCIPERGLILKEHCDDTLKDWTTAAIAEEGTHLLLKAWLAKVKSKPVGTREQAAAGVPDLSSSGLSRYDSLKLPSVPGIFEGNTVPLMDLTS